MIRKQYRSRNVNCGHGEKIESDDHLSMIGERCLPALIRLAALRAQAWQLPGDCAFGDLEAELLKLIVYLRRPPAGILKPQLAEETSNLYGRPGSPSPLSGPPGLIWLEAFSMPCNHSRWFHDGQNIGLSRPGISRHNPRSRSRRLSTVADVSASAQQPGAAGEHLHQDVQATAKKPQKALRIAPIMSIPTKLSRASTMPPDHLVRSAGH